MDVVQFKALNPESYVSFYLFSNCFANNKDQTLNSFDYLFEFV